MDMMFTNKAHKDFYIEYLKRCRYQDVYHKALIYCLGISEDTRRHVNSIYDFEEECIKTECLREGWQTSGSVKVVRLAFNLYTDGAASAYDYEDHEQQLEECMCYSVSEIMCSSYARYFWEAVKIRYPEYCE